MAEASIYPDYTEDERKLREYMGKSRVCKQQLQDIVDRESPELIIDLDNLLAETNDPPFVTAVINNAHRYTRMAETIADDLVKTIKPKVDLSEREV